MSPVPAQDRIELEVRDFGPIVEANLNLRPLTVFIGPRSLVVTHSTYPSA